MAGGFSLGARHILINRGSAAQRKRRLIHSVVPAIRVLKLRPNTTVGMLRPSGPSSLSRSVLTLPIIMLVISATASSTSSLTAEASVMSIAVQIRQAIAGEHVKLPVPAQLPAMPMNETTPSLGSAVVASTVTSPLVSSLPSIIEKTSLADRMRDSTIDL